MSILNKIFLALIAISVFIFLVSITFINNNLTKIDKPFYKNLQNWTYNLVKNNTWYKLENISNNSWEILVLKINISDEIIYSNWKVNIKKDIKNTKINISNWIYFFNFNELDKNYTVTGSWFEITNKGPWNFIVNNINPRKILVFSNNTLLNLKLKNLKTNEDITTIYLYPHKYLIFNPLKNIFVKNADLLKISQAFNLWYFNNKIELSEKFINLISLRNEKIIDFIKTSINYNISKINENNKIIKEFTNSKFWFIPWEEEILKYFSIFINPSKKSIYYKNLLIRQINKLIKSENIDIKTINSINDNIEKLWEIDPKWKNKINEFIKFYYTTIINSNSSINTKINFTKLINKINNTTNKIDIESLIYLNKIFNNYNSTNFYENINKFTKKYFDDLKINLDIKEKNKIDISEAKWIDYLLYFLENIMLNSDTSGNIKIWDIISVFNNYVIISENFYKYNNNDTKKVGLFTYSKILNQFKKIINNTYFIKRDENNILIPKSWVDINKKDIKIFEKNINKILEFFNKNKIVLDTKKSKKDKFLNYKIYPNLKKEYIEYFYALNDYEEYLAIYDTSKKELLETKSINEWKINNNLSIEKIKKYLKQFNWVSFQNTKINIMDYGYCINPTDENLNIKLGNPYCYKIENLLIDKQKISFILYPFLQNKIDYITINDEPKSWSYKLDEIKVSLEKKLKTVKEYKEKEKYKFDNFLVNTFWRKLTYSNNTNNTTNQTKKENIQEDSVIRIFKRNKLLWDKWDFANIIKTINIKYNELEVTKKTNSDKYNIYINSSTFFIKISKTSEYRWLFSSEYNFSEKHSFINPEIKLLDKKTESPLLYWNTIYIKWEIKVNNITNILKEVLNNYIEIEFVLKNILESLSINKVDIYYDKQTKTYSYELYYNSKKLIIKTLNWKIINIIYNNNNIYSKSTNYKLIKTILNNIK